MYKESKSDLQYNSYLGDGKQKMALPRAWCSQETGKGDQKHWPMADTDGPYISWYISRIHNCKKYQSHSDYPNPTQHAGKTSARSS